MKLRYIKHTILFAAIILLLSGCSIVYINRQSIDEIVYDILKEDTKLKTVSLEGYSYYLPQGVNLKNNSFLNSTSFTYALASIIPRSHTNSIFSLSIVKAASSKILSFVF